MQPKLVSNHICFTHPQPDKIASVIPGTKVNGYLLGVPLTLDNAQVLRNLGVPAPSPIRVDYKWPGSFSPRWYQVEAAEFYTLHKRAFNLSAMRTGKTLSTLWAADYLMSKGLIRRVLILAPLSTLEKVWADTLFIHFFRRKYAVLYGSSAKRKELLNTDVDFYVINHHGVDTIHAELLKRDDIDLIVIDEVAVMRNSQTKMWKKVKALMTPDRWVWGLTGTPTPSEPTDAYGQMKLIKPENYLGSFTKFRNDVMQQFGPYKWVPRRNWEDTVKHVLRPSIRFERTVCTDMEPCYIDRTCELSPEQREHFVKLQRECVTEIRGNNISAVNAGVLLSKLCQAACGVVYASDGKTVEIDFGPRLKVLEELIEENDEKVLVFIPFTGVLDAVARELRKRWTVEVVDGGVPASRRNKIFHDFQNSKAPHVLVCHPQCMAHGLDLTAASLSIFYAPCYSNEIYQQACARTDGSKQKVKIDIAHIYATNAEKRIYETLRSRGSMQQIILDMAKDGVLR